MAARMRVQTLKNVTPQPQVEWNKVIKEQQTDAQADILKGV